MKYRLVIKLLINHAFVTVGFAFVRRDSAICASKMALAAPSVSNVDDAAIGEAVLLDIVPHDSILLMGIYADVCIMRETEVHDVTEDAVNVRIAGNTVNDMIGLCVIQPLTIVYVRVGRLRRRQESEIADNATSLFQDKAAMLFHIAENVCLRWVAFYPLVHVS